MCSDCLLHLTFNPLCQHPAVINRSANKWVDVQEECVQLAKKCTYICKWERMVKKQISAGVNEQHCLCVRERCLSYCSVLESYNRSWLSLNEVSCAGKGVPTAQCQEEEVLICIFLPWDLMVLQSLRALHLCAHTHVHARATSNVTLHMRYARAFTRSHVHQ